MKALRQGSPPKHLTSRKAFELWLFPHPRISEKLKKAFIFYKSIPEKLTEGFERPRAYGNGHLSALEAFWYYENGEHPPTREPEKLARVLLGKKGLNLHVDLWARGILEGCFRLSEFQKDYPELPDEVWIMVQKRVRQLWKQGKRPIGWEQVEGTTFAGLFRLWCTDLRLLSDTPPI